MIIVNAEQISKSYGIKPLFDRISLSIETGDRIGLIGVNGTGKSTLLKILAGIEAPDDGRLSYANGASIAFLQQNPSYEADETVLSHVLKSVHIEDATLLAETEAEAKRILSKLGIEAFDARMGTLSGGQRKRTQLAAVLIQPADLLILDEPTNHLDTDAVDWLETYLLKLKSALLMITHDRYFLDRIASGMLELDHGTLYPYSGNYSTFLQKKAERLEMQHATESKRQNLLRGELAWMRRGARARTTKQKARIDRFHELEQAGPGQMDKEMDISLLGSRLGKKVIEIHKVTKSLGGRTLFRDFDYIVQKKDRIGIVGKNGRGKSTLLKLIAGKLQPDDGSVVIGTTVSIGYFSQESEEMDTSLRVIEYVKQAAERIQNADGTWVSASQMLELFLFTPETQWTPISKLSGGEKRRLYLLRILMASPNVLLLDEPTNDLDIQTLTVLESYLDDFPGAVITVSHDRFFLDRIATSILSFEDDAKIAHHVGNYSDYAELREQREAAEGMLPPPSRATASSAGPSANGIPADQGDADRKSRRSLKFSFNEQREYEQIDDRIAEAERRLEELGHAIGQVSSDYEQLQKLTQEQREQEKALEHLIERWTYLSELAEAIEQQKT